MVENLIGGLFIAIDGPNGVEKTTIIKALKEKLHSKGYDVYLTKEPSESKVGDFLCKESETVYGEALACLTASDRYEHLDREIKPALKENKIVLSDCYIMSSLILQCMDEVDEKFVMDINSSVVKPDMQIILNAPTKVLQQRLEESTELSRFEKEIYYMNKGIECLKRNNVKIYEYNTLESLEIVILKIYIDIIKMLNKNVK